MSNERKKGKKEGTKNEGKKACRHTKVVVFKHTQNNENASERETGRQE